MTKSQRAELYAMFDGHCAYCGQELPPTGWHADHIEPVMRDGKWVKVDNHPRGWSHVMKQTGVLLRPENQRKDNYFPACRACNIDKSCMPLEDWRKSLEDRPRVCRDNHSAFRHAERFGLVAVIETKVTFYFERIRAEVAA